MNTKLVYVLVSSDNDIYLEQAYLSMFSAKKHNESCHIVLLVDNDTATTFIGNRKKMSSLADEIVVVELDSSLSAHYRSRLLKTGIRKYVKGDFLFIDSDTIIIKSLEEIDKQTASIAACIDSHVSLPQNPYRRMIYSHVNALDSDIDIQNESQYFNSGVIYVKDDDVSYEFYDIWQKEYIAGTAKNVKMDQPSFYVANRKMNKVVKVLPDIWNCELKHGIKYISAANIVHYLCTNISKHGDAQVYLLNQKEVFGHIKQTAEIPAEVYECMEHPLLGINDCTTLVSGLDNDILRSQVYTLLKKWYSSPIFDNVEGFLKKLSIIKSKFRQSKALLVNKKITGGVDLSSDNLSSTTKVRLQFINEKNAA